MGTNSNYMLDANKNNKLYYQDYRSLKFPSIRSQNRMCLLVFVCVKSK